MGLQKITFDGASITAKVDADLYHFLLSNQVGIIKGFKNGVSVTVSNSTFNFKDGYVSVFEGLSMLRKIHKSVWYLIQIKKD